VTRATVGLLFFCFVGAACARSGSSPATTSARSSDAPAAVNAALADARARAAKARALAPPAYKGSGADANALAFMNGPLMSWIKRRRALQSDALDAYRLNVTPSSPAVAAHAAYEGAELELDFAASFIKAASTAEPSSIRADADRAAAFRTAVRDAASPEFARARKLLEECVDSARAASLAALGKRCAARRAGLPGEPADAGAGEQ
jgi:hypothetical protein